MRINRKFFLPGAVAFILFSAFPVWPQSAPAPPVIRAGPVTIQGSIRSRLEVWDWFQASGGDGSYAFSGNILRLSAGQNRKSLDWQLEFAVPVLTGLPEDAVAPGAQGALGLGANYYTSNRRSRTVGFVFPKQGFIRMKNLFGEGHALRVGRFEYVDGTETTPADPVLAWVKRERISQRLIGSFAWTHVGRSYDGAHYTWTGKNTNVTMLGALPTRGVFQTDGWGNLSTAIGYAALTRNHNGTRHASDWRVFGIYYQDWRDVVKTDNRSLALRNTDLANLRIGSFGGHYLHRLTTPAGPLDATLWGVVQTGRWGRADHRGHAWLAEAGWQPNVLPNLKPWIRAGYSKTSGDDNPLDGKHGTFFQILPTPRPYARFPFFNMMNNEDLSGMLLLRPHKAVTLRTEVHGLRLSEGADLWYLGGGAFQPWSFGYIGRPTGGARSLATLYDVSTDYQVNSRITLTGYFGHARGHSVIRAIYPQGRNANFGYAEILYRF